MRITTKIDGPLAEGGAAARVQERLRWTFGTYASEITRVTFRATAEAGPAATLVVRLRSQPPIELTAEGRSLEDVVAFLARRARAAVARRLAAGQLGAG